MLINLIAILKHYCIANAWAESWRVIKKINALWIILMQARRCNFLQFPLKTLKMEVSRDEGKAYCVDFCFPSAGRKLMNKNGEKILCILLMLNNAEMEVLMTWWKFSLMHCLDTQPYTRKYPWKFLQFSVSSCKILMSES